MASGLSIQVAPHLSRPSDWELSVRLTVEGAPSFASLPRDPFIYFFFFKHTHTHTAIGWVANKVL